VYGVLLHFHAFQGQGMPDNPQVQDWDKLCSKALKLCFDAMCDTALVFFGIFKVIILIALKKVFQCKCPELELSLKSSTLQALTYVSPRQPHHGYESKIRHVHRDLDFSPKLRIPGGLFWVKRNPAMFFWCQKVRTIDGCEYLAV